MPSLFISNEPASQAPAQDLAPVSGPRKARGGPRPLDGRAAPLLKLRFFQLKMERAGRYQPIHRRERLTRPRAPRSA